MVDVIDRIDVKLPALHRRRHFGLKHQVVDVGARHHHALGTGQSNHLAQPVEAFDLFVGAADRLHVAVLIDRSGDRQVLPDGTPLTAESNA